MSERRVEAQIIGPGSPGYLRVHLGQREQDVPVDRLPLSLRIPNARFVAVMEGNELVCVESAGPKWIDIQNRIRAVLNRDWDPIGVADAVADEYDGYIGGIYSMLQRQASADELATYLLQIETNRMGLPGSPAPRRFEVARQLRALELPNV